MGSAEPRPSVHSTKRLGDTNHLRFLSLDVIAGKSSARSFQPTLRGEMEEFYADAETVSMTGSMRRDSCGGARPLTCTKTTGTPSSRRCLAASSRLYWLKDGSPSISK